MIWENLLNIIFPTICLHCDKNLSKNEGVCGDCFAGIKINQTAFCGKCRARLPNLGKICHKDFPYVLAAATEYDGASKSLIHGLKFKYVKAAAGPLNKLLVKYAELLPIQLKAKDFLVIPVPLHKKRLRERSFNQSELIAKKFSEHFGLQLETSCLIKTKKTKPQSETKNIAERRSNVSKCFSCFRPDVLRGRNIILIDDVATSGATLLAAAETLKSAGAKKIIAFVVAKA